MLTLVIALGSLAAFGLAYFVYGRWIGREVFRLDPNALAPSHELRDDVDYVPTRKSVIFGHHFTSIAGTGPIVGPAIAVFWGWLPALLWVVLGSIFVGAVHDFGSLVVSLRNRGQTIGEVAGRLISPRAKVLFLLILFFALTVVLAIFGLVIASIFALYPESVLSVWLAMPLAVALGVWMHRGGGLLIPSLVGLLLLYVAVAVGAYWLPVAIPDAWCDQLAATLGMPEGSLNPVVVWTAVLFGYCYLASVLPVWLLLQPRDYLNSQQLFVALGLLMGGIVVASLSGRAQLAESAPAVVASADLAAGAPPILPFLFITIACGAISGFHCLVSSGTSSKQLSNETDATAIGYGGMLLEGALAVIVILACCAGVGMGAFSRVSTAADQGGVLRPYEYVEKRSPEGAQLVGRDAWAARYDAQAGWSQFKLGQMVGAFVDGGANFVAALGVPLKMSVAIIAVLVACFAATTLDTATRLQRYVIQEIGASTGVAPLRSKYVATTLAVTLALLIAMLPGPSGVPGTGGLLLWPLFGATNQLLAGLALLVTAFYLLRRNRPTWFLVIPLAMMIILPAWALGHQMFDAETGWVPNNQPLLATIGAIAMVLQAWMLIEAFIAWPKARGVLEEALPPLPARGAAFTGRSC